MRTLLILACLALASPAGAQPGCQPRIDTQDTWATPGLSFGHGTSFDYPGVARTMQIVSLTADVNVLTNPGQVWTPSGPMPEQPDALRFKAFYWADAVSRWAVTRNFGPVADAAVNTPLTPFDQWWAAVSNDGYPTPVLVRWTLHVVVC